MLVDFSNISIMSNIVLKILKPFRTGDDFRDDYNVIIMCIYLAVKVAGVSLGIPRDKWSSIASDMFDVLSNNVAGLDDKIAELDGEIAELDGKVV